MIRIRRIVRALAAAANWQCSQCDTYNAPTDQLCLCCGMR